MSKTPPFVSLSIEGQTEAPDRNQTLLCKLGVSIAYSLFGTVLLIIFQLENQLAFFLYLGVSAWALAQFLAICPHGSGLLGNAWQIKIKPLLHVFLQRENKNCFLLLLIRWSQCPHLTSKKVGIIRVSPLSPYLSPGEFLWRNVRRKTCQLLTKLFSSPYGQQRPPSSGWASLTMGSPFGLCGIFASQVWVLWFTWRKELLGDSSPDKRISHNSQEGTAQFEREKQSQIVPYLERQAK